MGNVAGLDSSRLSQGLLFAILAFSAIAGWGAVLLGNDFRYGMHSDDYPHKVTVWDLEEGKWCPRLKWVYLRPLGFAIVTNLAAALPDQEVSLRLLWATVHLGNAFLVTLLVYRMVESLLPSIVAGGIMFTPVWAHEAVFWHSGAAGASLGTLVGLSAVHLMLSAISANVGWWKHAINRAACFRPDSLDLRAGFYQYPDSALASLE